MQKKGQTAYAVWLSCVTGPLVGVGFRKYELYFYVDIFRRICYTIENMQEEAYYGVFVFFGIHPFSRIK